MLAVALVLAVRFFSAEAVSLTGTNSVDVAAVIAQAKDGERTCIRDLYVPEDTGRVSIWFGPQRPREGARVRAWLVSPGQSRLELAQERPAVGGSFVPFLLPRQLERDLPGASVCLVPIRQDLDLGGASVQRLPGAPITSVNGARLTGVDVAVRFELPAGTSRTVLEQFDDALERSSVFDPWLARALTWLIPGLLVLLGYIVLRVAARADSYSSRRLGVTAAGVAFLYACAWGLLMHPLHGADESEHVAYAQHLAATNERPAPMIGDLRSPYASSELRLMEGLHHNSTILNPSSRPRWERHYERAYVESRADARDDDGGGYTESATGHSPLYYALIGLPLRVMSSPDDLPSALLVMRLLNALMAAAVAGFVVMAASALYAGRLQVAWFAGMLAALQPVFGSVSAVVNNDTAVNVLAAILLYLLIVSWTNAPSIRRAFLIGAVAVALPVAKVTGFALIPVVGFAALVLALRFGPRASARWTAGVAAGAAGVVVAWSFVFSPLIAGERGAIYNVHPSVPSPVSEVSVPAPATLTLAGRAEYFIQTFVPEPHIGDDHWEIASSSKLSRWPAYVIYIERGYGLFGWKSAGLPPDLLRGILGALVFGWVAAVVAAVRHRASIRLWGGGALILAVAIIAVLALVSYAYATLGVRTEPGEQGRYVFPALLPLSVLFAAGAFAVRGRARELYVGAGVLGVWVLSVLAWGHALRGWFL